MITQAHSQAAAAAAGSPLMVRIGRRQCGIDVIRTFATQSMCRAVPLLVLPTLEQLQPCFHPALQCLRAAQSRWR